MVTLRKSELMNLKEECAKFDFVRFSYSDLHGISRGKVIPRRHVNQVLEDGIEVYAESLTPGPCSEKVDCKKNEENKYGNAICKAAVTHVSDLAWAGGDKYKVGEMLCELVSNDTVLEENSRYVARKQVKLLEEFGLKILSGSELEFILFLKDGKPVVEGNNKLSQLKFSEMENFLFDVENWLLQGGVDVASLEMEDRPGMFEMSLKPSFGISNADSLFRMRNWIKEISKKKGLTATTMFQPVKNAASLAHFNHSLWDLKTNKNVFYDASKPNNLSDVARHWIGGVMKHAKALTALCCPTVNCYRAIGAFMCPDKDEWDFDNRLITLRVKNGGERGTYMENRLASGASNVYVVMAATIAAGIDGIRNKVEPPAQGKRADSECLPRTLAEALDCLESDKVLIETLGQEFIHCFLTVKKSVELKKLGHHDVKSLNESELQAERAEYFEFF